MTSPPRKKQKVQLVDQSTSTEEYCDYCQQHKGQKAFSSDLECIHTIHVSCLRIWRSTACPMCINVFAEKVNASTSTDDDLLNDKYRELDWKEQDTTQAKISMQTNIETSNSIERFASSFFDIDEDISDGEEDESNKATKFDQESSLAITEEQTEPTPNITIAEGLSLQGQNSTDLSNILMDFIVLCVSIILVRLLQQ
ncbi:hypothetical protein AVEN_70002-1 [Araneus ventricosus]|uniref:RING-type domain-containing protein n=1 Tax=Araneus ventricosus TaxID=182803 RepID=A0A4Y2TLA6_ARAVE|nr:hypothetical protein AVEN_66025-1 [Araneus ventricosus]GBO01403.1 hypothetical protein AVEN_70002-1 [Araneus ventricosus]